jgi:ATP-dependent RNA helicase RhlE
LCHSIRSAIGEPFTVLTMRNVEVAVLSSLLALLSSSDAFSVASTRRSKTTLQLKTSTVDKVSAEPELDSENSSFSNLGLGPELLTSVKSQSDWDHPTPVQRLAIPTLLKLGRTSSSSSSGTKDGAIDSVWCEAPTGSGKTAAYTLPLLQNLLSRKSTEKKGRIASLILCPTRELAAQIGHVVHTLSNNISSRKKLNVMVLHGGVPLQPQIASLSDAARDGETIDVLVATPGRLVDVLTHYQQGGDTSARDAALERRLVEALDQQGSTDSTLSLEQLEALNLDSIDDDANARSNLVNLLDGLDFLVLDEADRLLGRAFASELDAVLDLLPAKIPTWMFSATFPKAIEPRLDQFLSRVGSRAPIRIVCASSDRVTEEEVSSSLQKKLERTSAISNASRIQQIGPASTIQLRSFRLNKNDRTQALRKLLEDHPEWDRVLVFVGTRYSTEHVTGKLQRAGIKAIELHGKLDQDARMRRLSDLKRGKVRVLLTTDVASRGLDIAGLPVVFNYDLPRSTVDFVHRVGRTGRAGRQGTAITFVTAASEAHMELIEQRHLAEPIEREILPDFHPNEDKWDVEAEASRIGVPGTVHSEKGLAHDRMFGGVKGRRKSKKDRLRESAARESARQPPTP